MLTPIEIQNKIFKSVGLGYDKKDVDSFIMEVLQSYEALYREKVDLMTKINTLTEGIQYYKEIEKTLQRTLLLAEKTAEDTKANALKNAQVIEKEAVAKSQMILSEAKVELERIHKQVMQLAQQYDTYKMQLKTLAISQIELADSPSFQLDLSVLNFAEKMPNKVEPTVSATASAAVQPELKEWYNPYEQEDMEFVDLGD